MTNDEGRTGVQGQIGIFAGRRHANDAVTFYTGCIRQAAVLSQEWKDEDAPGAVWKFRKHLQNKGLSGKSRLIDGGSKVRHRSCYANQWPPQRSIAADEGTFVNEYTEYRSGTNREPFPGVFCPVGCGPKNGPLRRWRSRHERRPASVRTRPHSSRKPARDQGTEFSTVRLMKSWACAYDGQGVLPRGYFPCLAPLD